MSAARAPLPCVRSRPARGRVLVFAPHADDETIGCGGTLALHRLQGDAVRVVVGYGAGDPGAVGRHPLRVEALRAGTCLGGLEHRFWHEPEGHEPGEERLLQAVLRARSEIEAFRPDTVYGPWIGEHHLDHHVLARVVERALAQSPALDEAWAYEVWTPLIAELVVDITATAPAKRAALRQYRSQLAHTPLIEASLGLASQRSLYLPKGSGYGEAFRRIRVAEERRAIA